MAYTPHTWTTNETITAAKLNNLEEGLSSVGGGNPLITFNFSGFGSYSSYWHFAIAEYDSIDDIYNALQILGLPGTSGSDNMYSVCTYSPNGTYVFPCPLPVPKDENLILAFLAPNNNFTVSVSGNISQSASAIIHYGSEGTGYIITGDCTINISANLELY